MMRSKRKPFAMAALIFVVMSSASVFGYQDVLDTPALRSPLASKTLLNSMAVAGDRIVCVGWKGGIVFSDDQGQSWTQASVPVSSDLTAVSFPTSREGWAVGHDGVVLHSSDAGATWVKQFDGLEASRVMNEYYTDHPHIIPPGTDGTLLDKEIKRCIDDGPTRPFLGVWFKNENDGFIVGSFNLIFRTNDGGIHWEPWFDRTENPTFLHLYSITALNGEVYISGERGLILKLDREGGMFRKQQVPYDGTLFGVVGNSRAVIAYGMRGNAFRTIDGGSHWEKAETGVSLSLAAGAVAADGCIALVSQGGELIVSDDDGASFTAANANQYLPASALVPIANGTVAIAGVMGVRVQQLN